MYPPKTGDRVRVVLEGVVTAPVARGFTIGREGRNFIAPFADHVVSIELLAPAEPPLGTVLLADASGIAYQREPGGWYATGSEFATPWTAVAKWDTTRLYTPDSE